MPAGGVAAQPLFVEPRDLPSAWFHPVVDAALFCSTASVSARRRDRAHDARATAVLPGTALPRWKPTELVRAGLDAPNQPRLFGRVERRVVLVAAESGDWQALERSRSKAIGQRRKAGGDDMAGTRGDDPVVDDRLDELAGKAQIEALVKHPAPRAADARHHEIGRLLQQFVGWHAGEKRQRHAIRLRAAVGVSDVEQREKSRRRRCAHERVVANAHRGERPRLRREPPARG